MLFGTSNNYLVAWKFSTSPLEIEELERIEADFNTKQPYVNEMIVFGRYIVTGGDDGTVRVWEFTNKIVKKSEYFYKKSLTISQLSVASKQILILYSNSELVIYNYDI